MHDIGAKLAAPCACQREVLRWRAARLRDAGMRRARADEVAGDRRYDLHELLDLTDRGCPAELALRILAPLGGEPEPR
jgi:hypothetical protein